MKNFRRGWLTLALSVPMAVSADLDEVVITATPLPVELYSGTQPATVLAGDELQRQIGASLGETLSHQVGVSSNFFGPIANRPVIRGLGGYRVQMLGDGLTSMDVANLSDDHAVTLDAALAEQIEVLRGPSALLYGSGAAGGVVNVVSERLADRRQAESLMGKFDLRGDSELKERSIAGQIAAQQGAWRWHADVLTRRTGDYVPNSASESLTAALAGGYLGERATFNVAVSRFETEYGLPVEEEAFIDLGQHRLDLKGSLALRGAIFDSLHWRAGLTDYAHTEFEARGEAGTQFDNEEVDGRITLERRELKNWRAIVGLQWSRQDFAAFGEEAFVPPSLSKTLGVFALVERPLGPVLTQLSARWDSQDTQPEDRPPGQAYDESATSVALGFQWPLAAGPSVALALSRSQRHPQATELFADGPHLALARFEIGDPTLRRETVSNIDVALRQKSEQFSYSIGGFFSRYDDYIFIAPTGDEVEFEEEEVLPVFAYGQNDAELYGFEIEVASVLGRIASAELGIDAFADAVRGRFQDGGDLPAMPTYRVGVGMSLTGEQWAIGADYVHHGKQTRTAANELPTDSFGLLSFVGHYRWRLASGALTGYLRASNLLDSDARLHASPLKDVVPLPGRSVRLGVRWEWGR